MAAAVVQHAAESERFVAGERARRRQASDATVSSSGWGRAWEAVEPGCSSGIAAVSKLGPVHTPEHPLIKPESRAKIFPLPSSSQSQKSESKNFRKKYRQLLFSNCYYEAPTQKTL